MRVLRVSHSSVVTAWRQRERELRARGVAVTLVTARRWAEGGSVVPFSPDGDDFAVALRTVGTHPNLFLYDPVGLWRVMGGGWDLVDVAEEPYSLAAVEILLVRALRARRSPFVVISAQNLAKRFPPPFRWTERWVLRRAAGAYVCNRAAGEILVGRGLRGPLALLPLGVDLDRFAPADRDAPSGTLRVGYVGRLAPEKGVAVLLEAARDQPSVHVDVAGDGPEAASLAGAATGDLGARVTFRGFVDEHRLPDHYRSLDVTVVPSVPSPGWVEQFCRVAVESMASGVPVVASASGALPEVVGDGGLLVPPGDPAALAGALGRLRDDPALWSELRARALAGVGRFSWAAVARDQHRLYREAVAGALPGPGDGTAGPRDLTVVVVAYGAPAALERCLAALGGAHPVVVVDNGSSAETAAVAAAHGARYVDPGSNLGFAAGVNRALAGLPLDRTDVLLLNPDAVVEPAAVETLRSELAARPRLAAVAPVQRSLRDGTPDRVRWPFPSPAGTWLEALGLGRLRTGRRAGFVIGSVLLLRGSALADVGGFDERFFLYDEETDWQRRAVRRGWDVALCPAATALHEGAGTDDDPVRRELRFHAGTERYLRKWYGPVGWSVARAGAVAGAAVRAAVLPGARGRAAARRARLFLEGPDRAARRRGVLPPPRPHVPELGAQRPQRPAGPERPEGR